MNPAKCSPAFPAGLSDLCNPKRTGVRYGRRCDVWMKSACVCPVRLRRNRTYGSARSPTTKNRARGRKHARAQRTGAERETAARGNGTRGRKTTRPRAKDRSGTRGRGAGEQGAQKKTQRIRARRAGAERETAARGNRARGRKTARPRAKDRCGTQDRSAGEQDARKKNNAPAREGPVRNARPRRGGTGRAEEKQRARARRAGAERKTAARGNVTRCGRGQAQDQWSRRTATKPSRTPITVKMAGFRLWAKACDCGSTSLKVT